MDNNGSGNSRNDSGIAAPLNELMNERTSQRSQSDEEQGHNEVTITSNSSSMVQWRGNMVHEKEAKALRHVFDNLQDHFAHQRPDPSVRFSASRLVHTNDVWSGELNFTYNINGDLCELDYMSMDICVDLTPKLVRKNGMPMMNGYGTSWVYCYLPEPTFERIKSYVKIGTGWDISDERTIFDPNRNLVAIEANLHHGAGQPQPSFWVIKDKDATGSDISFARLGSLQDVHSDSNHQCIHRGVGIFSVSMTVDGTPNFEPVPGGEDEVDLTFTLVSVRTWGETQSVAPIVFSSSRWS